MISSNRSSLENPAAWRCPPPPDFRAIAETSTSSRLERSETRCAGPAVARRLADQRDHLGALDLAEVVDDPLRVRLLRARLGEVARAAR